MELRWPNGNPTPRPTCWGWWRRPRGRSPQFGGPGFGRHREKTLPWGRSGEWNERAFGKINQSFSYQHIRHDQVRNHGPRHRDRLGHKTNRQWKIMALLNEANVSFSALSR